MPGFLPPDEARVRLLHFTGVGFLSGIVLVAAVLVYHQQLGEEHHCSRGVRGEGNLCTANGAVFKHLLEVARGNAAIGRGSDRVFRSDLARSYEHGSQVGDLWLLRGKYVASGRRANRHSEA